MAGPITSLTPGPTDFVTVQPPFSLGPHLQPQLDHVELLPPAAAARLRLLRLRASDAHRIVPEFSLVQEASMARIEAENALKRLTNHAQDHGFNLPMTDARVQAAVKHRDK